MAEFVYALFDFVPEGDDELPLKTGEQVAVLEKDEYHQDGWWTGRNLLGRIGIFPANYVDASPPPPSAFEIVSPSGLPDSAAIQLQFDELYGSIEEHLVHKESSLARRLTYASYVSSDPEEDGDESRRSSRGLRMKLAQRARRERAEVRRRQKEFGISATLTPAEADDLYGSDDDDELERATRRRLFESDDEDDENPFERLLRTPTLTRGKSLRRAATRRTPSTPITFSVPPIPVLSNTLAKIAANAYPEILRTSSPEALPLPVPNAPQPVISSLAAQPSKSSPKRSTVDKARSIAMSDFVILRKPTKFKRSAGAQADPRTWDVRQVVAFLQSRGFAADVCVAFEEQEISGDVLAELNMDNLENEIGISMLDIRRRLLAAIADLQLSSAQSIPTPVASPEHLPAKPHETAPVTKAAISMSSCTAQISLPTPDASPTRSIAFVLSSPPLLRAATPPLCPPHITAANSLPTPPETYPDPPILYATPRPHSMLPPSLVIQRPTSTSSLRGSRPRPVSTSSPLLAPPTITPPLSNASQESFRPPASPAASFVSVESLLPPGAARPRIPGAVHPYTVAPLLQTDAPALAKHGRHASDPSPTTLQPAPVFRSQPDMSAAFKAVEHAQGSKATPGSIRDIPNLLVPGFGRVGCPRGPRAWTKRS